MHMILDLKVLKKVSVRWVADRIWKPTLYFIQDWGLDDSVPISSLDVPIHPGSRKYVWFSISRLLDSLYFCFVCPLHLGFSPKLIISFTLIQLVHIHGYIIDFLYKVCRSGQKLDLSWSNSYLLHRGMLCPPEDLCHEMLQIVTDVAGQPNHALLWRTSPVRKLMSLGRLHFHPILASMNSVWSSTMDILVPCVFCLIWWTYWENVIVGISLEFPAPIHHLLTDASNVGWSAHMDTLMIQGMPQGHLYINCLRWEWFMMHSMCRRPTYSKPRTFQRLVHGED